MTTKRDKETDKELGSVNVNLKATAEVIARNCHALAMQFLDAKKKGDEVQAAWAMGVITGLVSLSAPDGLSEDGGISQIAGLKAIQIVQGVAEDA